MSIVIIPAYKPDETLVTITDQLWAYGCGMVVVDDGSGEEYRKIFDKIGDICIVLHHLENRGKRGRTANHPYKPEHEVSDGIFISAG